MAASSQSGPTLLGNLLTQSYQYSVAHWQTILIGAAVFGVVIGVSQVMFGIQAMTAVDQLGMRAQEMQELSMRVQQGDETALVELEALMNSMDDEGTQEEMRGQVMMAVKKMLPALGVSLLVSILVFILSQAYFILLAVEGKDAQAIVSRLPQVVLPLLGVSVWAFLRSFIWIPFIGIIPAIILGPRFIASSYILLTEKKGVMESVSASYSRTTGYWAKIVGNCLVVMIIGWAVMLVSAMVLGMLFFALPLVAAVGNQVVAHVFMAFAFVFGVNLSRTVLAHPRK